MTTSTVLQSKARQALWQSRIPVLRNLQVEETDEAVVLYGSVSSYYFKQLAQETVLPLVDGRRLHNRVTVSRS